MGSSNSAGPWKAQNVHKCCVSTEKQMRMHGYPAYTTSCAWLGYSDNTLKQVGI